MHIDPMTASNFALDFEVGAGEPEVASWRRGLPGIRDQYDDASCGCWASAYYGLTTVSIFHRLGIAPTEPANSPLLDEAERIARDTGRWTASAFSPAFIFNLLKKAGLLTTTADSPLVFLRDHGAVRWWSYPHSVGDPEQPNPAHRLERVAREHRLTGFGFFRRSPRPRWLARLKWWIAHVSPVILEIRASRPLIDRPLDEDFAAWLDPRNATGSHILACVGYAGSSIEVANSWGVGWAHGGLMMIPEEVVADLCTPGHLAWGMLPSWVQGPAPVAADVWAERMG